jgi:hypothetical protein
MMAAVVLMLCMQIALLLLMITLQLVVELLQR